MSGIGSTPLHEPVMVAEVVAYLRPCRGRIYVDATVGTGGHARELLSSGGTVIGVDRDPHALDLARQRLAGFGERAKLVQADFRDLQATLSQLGVHGVHGVLFDLGMSSLQLADQSRGFSFREDGPLDMRMDPAGEVTAGTLVNRLPERQLARILRELGEERYARRIAAAIVRARAESPVQTTGQLARLVARCYPPGRHRIHPATRTFQALRIAVNDELGALEAGLAQAAAALLPGGVVCAISYHSLEDRIVKHTFRGWAADGRVTVVTKRPVTPRPEEVAANPRARSAKLRAARVPEVAFGSASCPHAGPRSGLA
ncbi:MAG: 16S rRNA (cytosine(1402)-N(4))-methyltransferase RsmH [Candidatus Bipolaricaulaceae bacterium]